MCAATNTAEYIRYVYTAEYIREYVLILQNTHVCTCSTASQSRTAHSARYVCSKSICNNIAVCSNTTKYVYAYTHVRIPAQQRHGHAPHSAPKPHALLVKILSSQLATKFDTSNDYRAIFSACTHSAPNTRAWLGKTRRKIPKSQIAAKFSIWNGCRADFGAFLLGI